MTASDEVPALKHLPQAAVEMAVHKADRYRLLNEPGEAESICRDALEAEPAHKEASITLLLALADQFGRGLAQRFDEAMGIADKLTDPFERAYYAGVVCERRAKLHLRQGTPGCGPLAREWLQRAMAHFEEAIRARPTGGEEALLRFNACVRNMQRHHKLLAQGEPPDSPLLSD